MIRYTDDFVILYKNAEKAEETLATVKAWIGDNGIALHPDKVGDCRIRGEGLEFLWRRFEQGTKSVRKKNILKLREWLRPLTKLNHRGKLKDILSAINIIIKWWYNYFKFAYSSIFRQIDEFIRRRLMAIFLRRNKSRCSINHTMYIVKG
jgi:RNA-directed DNA polymerase